MRKIAVFTGSRAEYGLLVPVLRALRDHPELELQLVAGGSHLTGETEFPVAAHVPISRADETPGSTPRAIGQGVIDMVGALEALGPDLVVIYGDRFEAFAAMIAATQMSLPTAHIEGGDLTEGGTLDDVVRHSMSKLAHLHFATNAEAASRLRAMGEEEWRVHTVGFPPIDLIRAGDYTTPEETAAELGLDPARPIVLFTQHPISTAPGAARDEIAASLAALDRARAQVSAQIVLTYPNGDIGSDDIVAALEAFAARTGAVLRKSLGRRLYHGTLNLCGQGRGVCVGNSSSGLKETMAFACPAVDIGPRQSGRLRGPNVLHVPCEAGAIFEAIRKSIEDDAFRAGLVAGDNPYGQGDAGPRIAEILAQVDLADPALLAKRTLL